MKIRLTGNDALIYRFRLLIGRQPSQYYGGDRDNADAHFEVTDDEFNDFLLLAEQTLTKQQASKSDSEGEISQILCPQCQEAHLLETECSANCHHGFIEEEDEEFGVHSLHCETCSGSGKERHCPNCNYIPDEEFYLTRNAL